MAFDLTVMILVGGDEVDICADDDESMSVMICIPKKPFMNIHPWGIGWRVGELIWWHVYPWGLSNAGSHAGQRPTTRRTGCSFCIVSTSGVWVVRLLPPAPSPSPRTSPLHPPFSTLSPSFWVPKCLNQLHFLSLHPHTPQSTSLRLYSGLYAFFLPDDLFHIYLSDNSLTLSGLLPAPFFLWARHPLQVAFSVQSSWICGAHNMQKSYCSAFGRRIWIWKDVWEWKVVGKFVKQTILRVWKVIIITQTYGKNEFFALENAISLH